MNYEGTNVESAEQLVAKPCCKSMHSIEVKMRDDKKNVRKRQEEEGVRQK